ncbi:unnamed protein product [Tuber melanosporum]|uniref:(Perigord truffle) hypothetical protein n=1 Tax=Tuber melanosporum (strain Mel28) TaxID=656061 RepID=D5GN50_TUBMM|nr:uncharacterized protein GSTUM_00011091001 [Tuber melanosporum]CAZ85943.1 unnamed protein product [Tuber melanosporum]
MRSKPLHKALTRKTLKASHHHQKERKHYRSDFFFCIIASTLLSNLMRWRILAGRPHLSLLSPRFGGTD